MRIQKLSINILDYKPIKIYAKKVLQNLFLV